MNRISDSIGMAVCRVHRSALRGWQVRNGLWLSAESFDLRTDQSQSQTAEHNKVKDTRELC